MSDHDADPLRYLEDHLTHGRNFSGSDVTPASAHDDFLRLNQAERAAFLTQIDNRLKDAHLSLLDAQKLHSFRKKLKSADRLAKSVQR